MFDGWDPGSEGKLRFCKEIYLNDRIGFLWKKSGFLPIRIFGDREVFFGYDLVSMRIWTWESRLRKDRGKDIVSIKTRSFLLIFGILIFMTRFFVYGCWKLGIWVLILYVNQGRRIIRINGIRGIINGADFMNDFFYGCLPYIKESVWVSSITISKLFSFLLRNFSVVIISLVSMNQGQLVGNGGASKEGDGVRKRLKISVPHFDNSDLIKSYAMTLIGRCMNPEKQKVNALLMMLPKIWKVEERVTGADLGKGMFQIHFE